MAAPFALPNDDNTIPDPAISYTGTIDEWEQLAVTYASIAIATYLRRAGQSLDRVPFNETIAEIKDIAIDILIGENTEDDEPEESLDG